MSRKGKNPITLPQGVTVTVENRTAKVKGPKGTLSLGLLDCVELTQEDGKLIVSLKQTPEHANKRNFHGMTQALLQNMVTGVVTGFEKRLEMIGVGYRAAVKGQALDVQVGLSHPMLLPIPQGLEVTVDKNTTIIIKGVDKQKIGQYAATIRDVRPPEVYQGKGIRYVGEYVRKKAGKSATK